MISPLPLLGYKNYSRSDGSDAPYIDLKKTRERNFFEGSALPKSLPFRERTPNLLLSRSLPEHRLGAGSRGGGGFPRNTVIKLPLLLSCPPSAVSALLQHLCACHSATATSMLFYTTATTSVPLALLQPSLRCQRPLYSSTAFSLHPHLASTDIHHPTTVSRGSRSRI